MERLHKTIRSEYSPASTERASLAERWPHWMRGCRDFNHQRPHQALGMHTLAEWFRLSATDATQVLQVVDASMPATLSAPPRHHDHQASAGGWTNTVSSGWPVSVTESGRSSSVNRWPVTCHKASVERDVLRRACGMRGRDN